MQALDEFEVVGFKRIDPCSQLDHIQAALAAFYIADGCLRPSQSGSDVCLPQSPTVATLLQECQQDAVLIGMDTRAGHILSRAWTAGTLLQMLAYSNS